jgi:hypothetical protein
MVKMIKSLLPMREISKMERTKNWCVKRFQLRFLLYALAVGATAYYLGWL